MKNKAKSWMKQAVARGEFVDGCNEVQLAALAEACAWNVGCDSWLNDENHFVWDLAIEVSEWHQKIKK